MERNLKIHLLFLLLVLSHVCIATVDNCPMAENIFTDFVCYNDYNRIITCVWSSTYVSDHTNSVCTVDATKTNPPPGRASKFAKRSCKLEPVNISNPTLKSCYMDIRKNNAFQDFEEWSIGLSCNSSNQRLNISFKPFCSIKLNPPGKPDVNFTTVSWISQVPEHEVIEYFKAELQWKQENQPWKTIYKDCNLDCETELDPNQLIQGERYEARTRVQASYDTAKSVWSDWSPTTSWVSPVGKTKPPDIAGDVWGMIVAGAMTSTLFLAVFLIRTNTTTWILKKIRGPPIPNPATSFLQKANFHNCSSLNFTSEDCHSIFKPEKIQCVEVSCSVDAVAPWGPEAALLEKINTDSGSGSASSSFYNPSYSHVCSPPPISSLSAGNLQPCDADTPYGPVGNQDEADIAEQEKEEDRRKETELIQLLSKGSKDSESVQIISDYEKVEKLQVERTRLQSLDSGVCSGEEVSQESLESDSTSVTDSHEEESVDKEEEEEEERGNGQDVDFKELFGGSGDIIGKGSIQLCSDYERVQKLQPDSSELPSLDSGVSSGGEEQVSQEESLEDVEKAPESTRFLFPPASSFPLPRPLSQLPLKFPELGLRPELQPLLRSNVLMSTSHSVEPSGDGYMPVKQKQG